MVSKNLSGSIHVRVVSFRVSQLERKTSPMSILLRGPKLVSRALWAVAMEWFVLDHTVGVFVYLLFFKSFLSFGFSI